MKILYDYQAFTLQKIGGVSRYNIELMKNLPFGCNYSIPPCFSDNVYLKEKGIRHMSIMPNNNSSIKQRLYSGYNRLQSLWHLTNEKFDVFHPTYFRPYYMGHTGNHPVVVTVHDLNYFLYPEMFQNSIDVKREIILSCKYADAIICVSEETRQNLLTFIELDPQKTNTIYLGASQEIPKHDEKRLHASPYILYVGGRWSYKNFPNFLKAYSKMNTKVDLVCTGKPFNEEEISLISQLKIKDRVFQKFVSDEEMTNLLCHAEFFVYPSIAEGFGLPILEAARCGCPSVVSDILCFHEVANDSAIYFNPNSIDDMAFTLEKAISDEAKLHELSLKAQENLKRFTWQKMAKETFEVYKKLI